jgi:hypothetical protein
LFFIPPGKKQSITINKKIASMQIASVQEGKATQKEEKLVGLKSSKGSKPLKKKQSWLMEKLWDKCTTAQGKGPKTVLEGKGPKLVLEGLQFSSGEHVLHLFVDTYYFHANRRPNQLGLHLLEGKQESVLEMARDKDTHQLLKKLFYGQIRVRFGSPVNWFDLAQGDDVDVDEVEDQNQLAETNFKLLEAFFSTWSCKSFSVDFVV